MHSKIVQIVRIFSCIEQLTVSFLAVDFFLNWPITDEVTISDCTILLVF